MATFKQFSYLIKIVEEGSFTAASEKLFIAQSALSRQIKLLEDEIEFEIFDRTEKRVKLTKAGEVFYKKIKKNMNNIFHIIEESKNIADGVDLLLKIAHSSTIIMDREKIAVLDQANKAFKVNFEINTMSSEQQILALLNGEIDIGLIRAPVLHALDELHEISIYQQPLYLAVNQQHPTLGHLDQVELSKLKDELFVSTPHPKRGGLSFLVSNLCLAAGFVPKKAAIQSRKISQLELVALGIGICIVPQEFENILPENVKFIPLKDRSARTEVRLVWKKNTDLVIDQIAHFLADKIREINIICKNN